ncbi:hypothetical protein RZR97_02660 [Hydrogenimonas thermophila]|uniref:hypothetical protein n=1 Tax=Hydrogenimonas thermophila TaxID=223786 RepID=UPI002936EF01|nr:hypothetical protein [Hydrogenimonas thermophila]WOE70481.1 hypothetical protein RZR91_02675 [Hydrogenimonas thermophila]WOE72998.1 hypothetical protein RZR97_02660 [Hydrogenimonas thermophila]
MKYNFPIAITTALLLTGCATTQPKKIENIGQFANGDGYKQYMNETLGKNNKDVSIIAEKPNEFIFEARTKAESTNMRFGEDVYNVIDNAREYCSNIGGIFIYGDQSIKELHSLKADPFSAFSYVSMLNDMKKQGKGLYSGFLKCEAPNQRGFKIDYMVSDIEVDMWKGVGTPVTYMRDYSRYYHVTQDKPQSLGYVGAEFKGKALMQVFGKNSGDLYTRHAADYKNKMKAYKMCVANGGIAYVSNSLTSNGKVNINEYLFDKMAYLHEKYTKPNVMRNIPIFLDYSETLWCESPNDAFTVKTSNKKVYIEQGVSSQLKNMPVGAFKVPGDKDEKSVKETTYKKVKVPSVIKGLANYTLSTKSDTIKSVGQISYKTSFNGIEPDGCEYASVTKVDPFDSQTYNFKKCGNNIISLGQTGVEDLTDEAKEQFKRNMNQFENTCKLQNYARMEANEFVMKCFKNPLSNNYKIIIMKNGKLVKQMAH